MNDVYIGVMSGTSANAVDAAMVDFSRSKPVILATCSEPIELELQQAIHAFAVPGENELNRLAEIDIAIARLSAKAINQLLHQTCKQASEVKAIGSHGQTIRHQPCGSLRYTIQVGDPNIITTMTGITTVADFRRRDIALNGQGAPLTPAFHQHIFADPNTHRAVLNLGGIANVSILPQDENDALLGFDSGPANTLLDHWIQHHHKVPFDKDGEWARQGSISITLLESLMSDPYFSENPPKSTGLEYFNLSWLQQHLKKFSPINTADVQATLAELTAISAANAIAKYCKNGEVVVCGGGAHNAFLMERLQANLPSHVISSSESYGIKPEWIEAVAFAWLAKLAIQHQSGNVPSVTGAKSKAVLGAIYQN